MRRTLAALALTAVLFGISAPAAFADEDGKYPPRTPRTPTLAGSAVASECIGDVPYIRYTVELTDPDDIASSHTAYLMLSGSGQSIDIRLGELKDNKLSGTILWPGASVDAQGKPTGWPGWAKVGDTWVQTSGNFGWTRGHITARLHVNPELTIPLSYPQATAGCASPAVTGHPDDPTLAITGGAVPYAAAAGGVLALGLGIGLVVRRRRHAG